MEELQRRYDEAHRKHLETMNILNVSKSQGLQSDVARAKNELSFQRECDALFKLITKNDFFNKGSF